MVFELDSSPPSDLLVQIGIFGSIAAFGLNSMANFYKTIHAITYCRWFVFILSWHSTHVQQDRDYL